MFFEPFYWKLLKTIEFSLFFSIFLGPVKGATVTTTKARAMAPSHTPESQKVLKNIEFLKFSPKNVRKHSIFMFFFVLGARPRKSGNHNLRSEISYKFRSASFTIVGNVKKTTNNIVFWICFAVKYRNTLCFITF